MRLSGRWLDDVYAQDAGAGDGSTVTFGLSGKPHTAASLIVSLNGLTQRQGTDYTVDINAQTITFTDAPVVGQELIVTYTKA